MSALAGVAGAATIAGLFLIVAGFLHHAAPPQPPSRLRVTVADVRGASRRRGMRVALGLVAGAVGWLMTGWPVIGLAVAVAAPAIPWMVRGGNADTAVQRLEALEQWTRRLADLLVVGAGIEQALIASVRTAPTPIAADVAALAAALQARTPTEQALRGFADRLSDPAGDLVAAALILAARRRGRGLATVLDGLARALADEVSVRRGIESDRAKPRTTARAVTIVALLAAGGLIFLDRSYVAPFATATGQLVLALVCCVFFGAFTWMHRLADVGAGRRFLADERTASSKWDGVGT